MLQYGMPTLIENRSLQDNIALCSSLGLRFIELNMNFPEYQIDRLEQTDPLLEAAGRAGIYYTIHLDENMNIADFNPLVSDAYLQTVRRSVCVAKKLLCLRDRFGDRSQPLTLNMHMHHGIFITLPDRKVQMYERDFGTYMESFARFRSLCEDWIGDSDLRIAVEQQTVCPVNRVLAHIVCKRCEIRCIHRQDLRIGGIVLVFHAGRRHPDIRRDLLIDGMIDVNTRRIGRQILLRDQTRTQDVDGLRVVEADDRGLHADAALPAVEDGGDPAVHVVADVTCCGRAGLAGTVRRRRRDRTARFTDERPCDRVRRHPDADGI